MTVLHAFLRIAALAAVTLVMNAAPSLAQPRVVASILPVQSLVAGVMEGVGTPSLIVQGAASPHTYALRPSDARALNDAKLVFWVGEIYEGFLEKPLASLAKTATVVELQQAAGVTRLAARSGGVWGDHDHGHKHSHAAKAEEMDGHLFLDPANAKAMVRAMVTALSTADAANKDRYAANGDKVLARLDALDGELKAMLDPVKARPFVVFHDAYQYVEKRYGLTAAGAITIHPERKPGARRVSELRKKVANLKAVCVFSEPQFEPSLVRTITEGTSAKSGVLDPLGADLAPGADAYFTMMRRLGTSLAGCLRD